MEGRHEANVKQVKADVTKLFKERAIKLRDDEVAEIEMAKVELSKTSDGH